VDKIEEQTHWAKPWAECPDCCGTEFLEGPHGGLSINFKCAQCGSTFNHMGPFGIDRLSYGLQDNSSLNPKSLT